MMAMMKPGEWREAIAGIKQKLIDGCSYLN